MSRRFDRRPTRGFAGGGIAFNPLADPDLLGLWVAADATDNGTTLTVANRKSGAPSLTSTGVGRASIDATGVNGVQCLDTTGMNKILSAALSGATGKSAMTVYVLAKHDAATSCQFWQFGTGNQSWFAYYSIAAGGYQVNKILGTSQIINTSVNGGLIYPRATTFRYDNTDTPDLSSVRQQGLSGPATPSGTDQTNPLASGSIYIGSTSAGGSPFDGKVFACAVIARKHSDADATLWEQYLNTLVKQGTRKEVAFNGDSLAACSVVGGAQWRARVETLFRAEAATDDRYWYMANGPYSPSSTPFTNDYTFAAGGSTIANMQADWAVAARQIGVRYFPDVMPILIGTNDIAAGATAAAVATSYRAALNDLRTRSPNTKAIAMKLIPRNDAFNSVVTTYNATEHDAMVAAAQGDGCNVLSDDTFATLGGYTYLDGVHVAAVDGDRMGDAIYPQLKTWCGV